MAKTMQFIIDITAQGAGAAISALRNIGNAARGLNGLSRTLTGSDWTSGHKNLMGQLRDLQNMSQQLERMKELQTQLKQMQVRREGTRQQLMESERMYRLQVQQLEAMRRQIEEQKRLRDLARTLNGRQAADEKLKVLEDQYRASSRLHQQTWGNYRTQQRDNATTLQGYMRQSAELRRLSSELRAAGISTQNMASAQATLNGKLSAVTQALQANATKWATQANNNLFNAGQNFSNEWTNMQSALTTAGALMQPFKEATENAETFEHAMSRVKALTQAKNIREGRTEQIQLEMAELEAQARHLGATTQFTMTQAAEAQGYLGMAGWKKDEIIAGMPGILDLAAASGMELGRTADIISNNLTAFGLKASDTEKLTDAYAYAVSNSNLNLEMLGETMKYAAPAMHAYGGDMNDAAAAVI